MADNKLGDLILPDNLMWDDTVWAGVAAAAERTLNGSMIVYQNTISGQPIDLTATETQGWITYEEVKALKAMASVVGAEYKLIYEGEEYTVRFRHEDTPVLQLTPLLPRPKPDNADYYYGTIRLMEV